MITDDQQQDFGTLLVLIDEGEEQQKNWIFRVKINYES